jgi:hypothetical protein
MKYIARVLGTWFLGLALILLIVDGTKSLAANSIVTTPLAESWQGLHAQSWRAVYDAVAAAMPPLSVQIADLVFSWPGWATFGVIGVLCAFAGRSRARVAYVESL